MYASHYIFSSKFFVAWVVVSIIWVWGTMIVAGFFPLIDGWGQIMLVLRGISGRRENKTRLNSPQADSVEVVETKETPDSVGKGESENEGSR